MKREPLKEGWTALDQDHGYRFTTAEGHDGPVGAMVCHRRPDGSWCVGAITWATPPVPPYDQARWELRSLAPLHVEPSVMCGSCADEFGDNGVSHGFIRAGRWEPAGAIPEWAT